MGKLSSAGLFFCYLSVFTLANHHLEAQCTTNDIMEPGFEFLTSSRGCAPFSVKLKTKYLASTPGTVYYVDWGDGSAEETYVQTTSDGVVIQHTYPESPVECGYDMIIDASNECNPRGSVTPIETQIIVWTNDVISINPKVFRVCQGFAANLQFTDNSDWNCFPRDSRENNENRWIQWIYGTGNAANRIPDVTVDNESPSSYPYQNPDPEYNPVYPVSAPGQVTLPIQIPGTSITDIDKEFEITLRNWNQCNPYDNDLKDGDPRNPVNGDMANGDNAPMETTARIVIVPSPEADYQTRAASSIGPVQNTFCIGDEIYFEDLTPAISGARFQYIWEFYDGETASDPAIEISNDQNPLFSYSSAGKKLVRLRVKDENAAGNCESVYEQLVYISPLLQASIGLTDTDDVPMTPDFCQVEDESLTFTVRFHDESVGTVNSDIRWRWEFYDQNGDLFRSEPSGEGYSSTALGPFDLDYQQEGQYKVRLIVKDEATECTSQDIAIVKVSLNPLAAFDVQDICFGDSITFSDQSSAAPGQIIKEWNYDLFNDGITDTTFTSSKSWRHYFEKAGDVPVKLKVVSDQGCADSTIQTVVVKALPEATITADKLSGCSELEVAFTNTGWDQAQAVDYYQWEVNSGNGFVQDSIQHPSDPELDGSFTRSFKNNSSSDRIFQVRMIAVGENGCSSISDTLEIKVTPGAASGFLYTNYSPFSNNCSPREIHFQVDNETQSVNPSAYNWEVFLEDNLVHAENTGTMPEFSHVFTNSSNVVQEFQVRLTTHLSSNCSSDSSLYVNINPVPSADFSIDTLEIDCNYMRLKFDSKQKGLPYYQWRLESEGTVIYSYEGEQDAFEYHFDRRNAPVNIQVSLTTKNMVNCASEKVEKTITIPTISDFIASFTVDPASVSLPDATVQITDNSTAGDYQYVWDFGNGDTSADPALSSYTYSNTGDYTIELTISDGSCSKSYKQNVKVTSPPPTADFSYSPGSGCSPLNVSFTNLSTYGKSYFWEFGDGATSTAEHPEYLYTSAGTYSVKLTVKGENGEQVIIIKENIIEVYDRPIAYFEARPSEVFIPDMPVHTRNLSENATSYHWDFGDGSVSTELEPVHYYKEEGVFDITLLAYNENCSDSVTKKGAVKAKSAGRVLIPNAFTPSRSGPNGFGENDQFVPLISDVAEYRLQIFNRWGELLFEGVNQGWDGYYQGRLSPQDVYVYKVEIVFNNGEEATRVGDVNLIR